MIRISTALCFAVTSSLILGCGTAGDPLTQLNGKIRFQGKPLDNVNVMFMPKEAGGTSCGVTDADGNFTLTYLDQRSGVLPGEHLVTITETHETPADSAIIVKQKPVREYRQILVVDANMTEVEFDLTGKFK